MLVPGVGRRDLYLATAVIALGSGYIGRAIEISCVKGFGAAALDGFGVTVVEPPAVAVALNLLLRLDNRPASPAGLTVAGVTLLLALAPWTPLSWIGLSLFGALLVLRRRTAPAAGAGAILLSLCSVVFWSHAVLDVLGEWILTLDAMGTHLLVSALDPGAVRDGTLVARSSGHALAIMAGCSSINNIAIGSLVCLTLGRLRRPGVGWRDVTACLETTVLIFALNVLRLSLMAISPPAYELLHHGWGVELYHLTLALGVLLVCHRRGLLVPILSRRRGGAVA
jgi:exosortase/archaeosortase family protein